MIHIQRKKDTKELERTVYVTHKSNQNITISQKELLKWNFRMGNIGFKHVKWLNNTRILKVQGNSNSVANFERTNCAGHEFGKGHRQSNEVNKINNNNMNKQDIKKYNIIPGHMVFEYYYILRGSGNL